MSLACRAASMGVSMRIIIGRAQSACWWGKSTGLGIRRWRLSGTGWRGSCFFLSVLVLRLWRCASGKTSTRFSGQTHLNFVGLDAQEAQQVGMIPTGVEHFAADAAFFGSFSFQEVEGQAAQGR